jgi:outer membrane immunogenic protein
MIAKLCLTSAAAAALALAAVPALAQDAPATWTGPYVGLNLGYGGGSFKYPYSGTTDIAGTNPVAGQARQDSSGVLGGVTAGYNYEMSNGVLVGLEADIDASDIGGKTQVYGADNSAAAAADIASRIDYLGTARVRVGKAMFGNRFVPYVTGGFAYGGVRSDANYACSSCTGYTSASFDSPNHLQTGWTVGGGAEYALTRHLSMKAEYLYVDLRDRNLDYGGGQFSGPGFTTYNTNIGEKADANIVRVGLNWRF